MKMMMIMIMIYSRGDERERFKIENKSFGLKERDIYGQPRYAGHVFAERFPIYSILSRAQLLSRRGPPSVYFQRNDFISLEFRFNASERVFLLVNTSY